MFERSGGTWTDTDKFQEQEGLVASSWQNFKTTNTTAPACSSADNSKFGTASNTADSFTITSSDNNKWACFRVKDSSNTYHYVKRRIDFNPPAVTITQTGDSLQASSTATDLPDNPVWEYRESTTDPTCSNLSSGWVKAKRLNIFPFLDTTASESKTKSATPATARLTRQTRPRPGYKTNPD